ncbi:MAG: hypothetical protein LAO55_23695 [Acidobacteriia bacterium]|nr:hypothetical protein [Terriglobia bacterium]
MSAKKSLSASESKLLFHAPPGFGRGNAPGAWGKATADGKRFLLTIPVPRSSGQERFTAVLNWTTALKK